jgi:TRAP-type C4-dicarboxylate transport system permease small subunit
MLHDGWAFSQLSQQRFSPALGITLLIPTIVIPASGALIVLAALAQVASDLHRIAFGDRP